MRCTSRAIILPQFLIKGDNNVGTKENRKSKKIVLLKVFLSLEYWKMWKKGQEIELCDGILKSKNYSYVSKCTRLPSPRVKCSQVISVASGPKTFG